MTTMASKLTLSVADRLLLSSILPQTGGKVKMILVRSIAVKVEFTPEEISAFELRDEANGFVRWNPAKDHNVEVSFSPEEVTVLKEAAEDADKRQVITRQMLPLIEQIESL